MEEAENSQRFCKLLSNYRFTATRTELVVFGAAIDVTAKTQQRRRFVNKIHYSISLRHGDRGELREERASTS